jgi:3-polyprenyl-4-hydroxybenzoate decarboxylase
MPDPSPTRVIVAITGASGAVLGIRTLERLRALSIETHLVISAAAGTTIRRRPITRQATYGRWLTPPMIRAISAQPSPRGRSRFTA